MNIIMKFKKIISIFIISNFIVSFVIGPTAANTIAGVQPTEQYNQIFNNFMLPYNFGQITAAHYGATDRVLINIQDLHSHPKVQKNISNIIELFDKKYGVNKVFLEGAYGQVSTKWISDNINKRNKTEILDMMLDTGRLTGAEYYSAKSDKTEIIKGLEKKEPYLDNLKRFGQLLEEQDKVEEILKTISDSTKELKKKYYDKRQFKIEQLSKDYKENKIKSKKYYTLLSKHIDKLGIDINKYENTLAYIMLLELQKNLDYGKITRELQNLIYLLKEQIPYNAYKMLIEQTDNFKRIDSLYAYIIQIVKIYNLDLSANFSNLDKYFRYIELSKKINPIEMISEEDKLRHEINTRFSETKAQRDVVFLIDFEKYLRDYITTKITSDDYKYYKENINSYIELYNKYADNRVLSLLDGFLKEVDNFYSINSDRNIYFTDNMFNKEEEINKIEGDVEGKNEINKIIENMKQVKNVDIVVTGGFHSQTVTEILKNQGVSYIVITPNVTDGVKLAEQTYHDIVKEQSKVSFQTIASLITSLSIRDQINLMLSMKGANNENIFSEQEIIDIYGKDLVEKAKQKGQEKNPILEAITPKVIELANILQSDDAGTDIKATTIQILKDRLGSDFKDVVNEELLDNIDSEKIKKLLEDNDISKLQKVITTVSKDSTIQQAADLILDIAREIQTSVTKSSIDVVSKIDSEGRDISQKREISQTKLTTIPTKIVLKILRADKEESEGKEATRREKIINFLENWQIMLGIFFPFVNEIFIKKHGKSGEENARKGVSYILKHSNAFVIEAINSMPYMNFFQKIVGFIMLISRKYTREDVAAAHIKWNRGLINQNELKAEKVNTTAKPNIDTTEISVKTDDLFDKDHIIENLWKIGRTDVVTRNNIFQTAINLINSTTRNDTFKVLDALIKNVTKYNGILFSKQQHDILFEKVMDVIKNNYLSQEDKIKLLTTVTDEIKGFKINDSQRNEIFDESLKLINEKGMDDCIELIISVLNSAEVYDKTKINKLAELLLKSDIFDNLKNGMLIFLLLSKIDFFTEDSQREILKVAINYSDQNIANKNILVMVDDILDSLARSFSMLDTKQKSDIFALAINRSNNWREFGNKSIYTLFALVRKTKELNPNQQEILYKQINSIFDRYTSASTELFEHIIDAISYDDFVKLNDSLQSKIVAVIDILIDNISNKKDVYRIDEKVVKLLDKLLQKKYFMNERQKNRLFGIVINLTNKYKFSDISKTRLFEVLYENIEMFSQRQQNKINKIIKKMGVDKFSRTKIEDYFYSPIVAKIRSVANKVENKYKFFRITDLSFANRAIDKEAKDFFQIYKNLEIENLKTLNLLMNLSSKNDIEQIRESLKKMFYYYKQLSVIFENQKEIVDLWNLLEEFFNQKQMDISNQKVLHGYDINSIFNAKKEDITINDLINVLHQSSITNFKKINSSINKKRTFERSVAIQNFSKDGYVNPEIKKLLSKIFEMEGVTVCFDEDTLIISVIPIDRHSTTIIVNVGNINRGISFSLYDGIKYRDLSVESMLKKIGFAAEFNGGFLVNGRLDKTSGLTEDIDLTEKFDMLLKMFYLTVKADEDSFSLYGLEDYVEKYMFATDNNLHQKETHALYDVVNEFYIYVKENYAFNTINNLNEILKKLGLPEISENSEYLYEEPKTYIKFLGQMGIDRYFNRVIERAFAEGKIVIDETGSLVKNNNFDEMANVTDLLNRINDDDILSQATIIDELNKQNEQIFNLQTKAKVGQLEYQEGYLQLSSGEYIFVKVLKNPINGMIRYAKAEIILSDGQRGALTAKTLAEKIRREGYRIKSDVRKKSERERKTFLTELNADSDGITKETTEVSVFGKLMGGQRASVVGRVVFDPQKVKKGESILFKEYLEPNDMDGTINANGIVLTSGAELSHQGLIVKEKGILATIIKDIKFVKDKNGKTSAKIRYVTYKKGTNLEGFSVQEIAEEKEVVIEEGAGVKIDGQTGSLIILNEKEYKEESTKYKPTAKIEQIESQKDQSVQSNQEIDIEDYTEKSISRYVKSFAAIKETIKEYFGTKATNLQEMFNVIAQIIKEKGVLNVEVPDGVMIGAGAFLKILQKKEGFNQSYKEYRQAIRVGNLNVAKEKARKIIEIINNLTKEDLKELDEEVGKYIDLKGVYAVRSAFIGEDGKKFSSAGVGESVVGVAGQDVTKNLINVVLKSAFSERSVAYQCSNKHEFIPAALVQVAVDSKKSVVMMVRDGKITISGSLGQGEIVVSGKKAQSIIEADVVNGEISISDYVTERQDYQYGFNGEINNVSDEDATAEIFSEDEIIRMCKTGLALREKYGYDSDIEIAIDEKGKIYVVQIRPITSKEESIESSQTGTSTNDIAEATFNEIEKDISMYLKFNGLKITPQRFEEVLEYLKDNNYEITEQTYENIQYFLYISAHDVGWTIFFHPELVEKFFDLGDAEKRVVYDFCKQNEEKIKGDPDVFSIIINIATNCNSNNFDKRDLGVLLNLVIHLLDDKVHREHFFHTLMENNVSLYFLQYYLANKEFFVSKEYQKLITYLIFSAGTGIEQYINQTYYDNSNFYSELKSLFDSMINHQIYDLNMYYNGLVIKIYFHPAFKKLVDEEFNKNNEELTPLIRYRIALAIAQNLYSHLKEDKLNLLDENILDKIMPECIEDFVSKKMILGKRFIFSDESDFIGDDGIYPGISLEEGRDFGVDRGRASNTGLIGICNNELDEQGVRRFSLSGIGSILNFIENKPRLLMNLEVEKEQDVEEYKDKIFKMIKEYTFLKKKYGLSNLVVVISGHGEDYEICLVGKDSKYVIGRKELAKVLLQAYENLEEITLDLSACNSYTFCENLFETLTELENEKNLEIKYPQIITEGGREIKYGAGRGFIVNGKVLLYFSNEIRSIFAYIRNKVLNNEKINKYLTLDDAFNSEIYDSNHTIVVSGQDVERLNIDFREKLIELLGEDFIFKDRQIYRYEFDDEVKYRFPMLSSVLTMTWLSNLLGRLKITDFAKRQKRINIIENPIIVLGALFPNTIGTWFARAHISKEEKKYLSKEQQEQKVSQIKDAMSIVLQQALNGPIIHFARNLAVAHTKWNLQQDSLQQQTISQEQEISSEEQSVEHKTIFQQIFSFMLSTWKKFVVAKTSITKKDSSKSENVVFEKILNKFLEIGYIDEIEKELIKEYVPISGKERDNMNQYWIMFAKIDQANKNSDKIQYLARKKLIVELYGYLNENINLLVQVLKDEAIYSFLDLLRMGFDSDFLMTLNKDLFDDLDFNKIYKSKEITVDKIKDFVSLLDKYNLNYIKEDRDLRIEVLIEYFFNNLNVSQQQLDMLLKLAGNLNKRKISEISTENDRLALKIFVNERFNELLKENLRDYLDIDSIGVRYDIALDISREIARTVGNLDNSNFINLDKMVELVIIEKYLPDIRYAAKKFLISSKTNFISFFAQAPVPNAIEKELGIKVDTVFDTVSVKYLLKGLGLNPNNSNYKYIERSKDENAKSHFLEEISKIDKDSEDTYIYIASHGQQRKLLVLGDDNSVQETLDVEEFAEEFVKLYEKGIDLSKITIDFGSCGSYFYALNLYDILQNRGVKILPNIWTTAGFETPFGIMSRVKDVVGANSLAALVGYVEKNHKVNLTALDYFKVRNDVMSSNATLFLSGAKNTDIKYREVLIKLAKDKRKFLPSNVFRKSKNIFENIFNQDYTNIKFSNLPTIPQDVSELTMTWLGNLLEKLNVPIKWRPTIINIIENPIIMLGALFPNTIGTWFARAHISKEEKKYLSKEQQEQKVSQVQHAMNIVLYDAGIFDLLPTMSFAKKISRFAAMLFSKEYKSQRAALTEAHTEWNRQQKQLESVSPLMSFAQKVAVNTIKNVLDISELINIPAVKDKKQARNLTKEEEKRLKDALLRTKARIKNSTLEISEENDKALAFELQNIFNSLLDSMVKLGKITEIEKKDYELVLYLSDEVNAFTVSGSKSVFISTGLLYAFSLYLQGIVMRNGEKRSKEDLDLFGYSQYMNEQIKDLCREHIAAILAHELEHTVQDRKKYSNFIAEKGDQKRDEYDSDIQAIFMLDNAGYNPVSVQDLMEFLVFVEETEKYNSRYSTILEAHPDAENRLIKIKTFLSDRNIFLRSTAKSEKKLESRIPYYEEDKMEGDIIGKLGYAERDAVPKDSNGFVKKILEKYGRKITLYKILDRFNSVKSFVDVDDVLEYINAGSYPFFNDRIKNLSDNQKRVIIRLMNSFDGYYPSNAQLYSLCPDMDELKEIFDFIIEPENHYYFFERIDFSNILYLTAALHNANKLNEQDYDKLQKFMKLNERSFASIKVLFVDINEDTIDFYIDKISLFDGVSKDKIFYGIKDYLGSKNNMTEEQKEKVRNFFSMPNLGGTAAYHLFRSTSFFELLYPEEKTFEEYKNSVTKEQKEEILKEAERKRIEEYNSFNKSRDKEVLGDAYVEKPGVTSLYEIYKKSNFAYEKFEKSGNKWEGEKKYQEWLAENDAALFAEWLQKEQEEWFNEFCLREYTSLMFDMYETDLFGNFNTLEEKLYFLFPGDLIEVNSRMAGSIDYETSIPKILEKEIKDLKNVKDLFDFINTIIVYFNKDNVLKKSDLDKIMCIVLSNVNIEILNKFTEKDIKQLFEIGRTQDLSNLTYLSTVALVFKMKNPISLLNFNKIFPISDYHAKGHNEAVSDFVENVMDENLLKILFGICHKYDLGMRDILLFDVCEKIAEKFDETISLEDKYRYSVYKDDVYPYRYYQKIKNEEDLKEIPIEHLKRFLGIEIPMHKDYYMNRAVGKLSLQNSFALRIWQKKIEQYRQKFGKSFYDTTSYDEFSKKTKEMKDVFYPWKNKHADNKNDVFSNEVDMLWANLLHNICGFGMDTKSFVFMNIHGEELLNVWCELTPNENFVPTAQQTNELLKAFILIKKYMSKEQSVAYARMLYEMIRKNETLSVFESAEKNLELLDFFFEGFSEIKDDYIYELLENYNIDIDIYDECLRKTTLYSYKDNTEDTGKNFLYREIAVALSKDGMSVENKIKLLAWLISDKQEKPDFLNRIAVQNGYEYDVKSTSLGEDAKIDIFRNYFWSMTKSERTEFIREMISDILKKGVDDKDYEILKNTLSDAFFDSITNDNNEKILYALKMSFKIIFDSLASHEKKSTSERQVLFISDLVDSLVSISKSNFPQEEKEARQIGKFIVAMGSASGVAVVKILQILSNSKAFEGLGKQGSVINEEISKVRSSNEQLSKRVVFQQLEALGILDDVESVGKCLGSASIGVTYFVNMKDGSKRIIKIKRPSVLKNYEQDLNTAENLIDFFKFSDILPQNSKNMIPTINFLKQVFDTELNFKDEVYNLLKAKENLSQTEIRTPDIAGNYNADSFMQTLASGQSWDNVKHRYSKQERNEIYSKILLEFFREVFKDGFFHADLHEGNIFIDENKNITFIDWGACGSVEESKKDNLKKVFISLLLGDGENFMKSLKQYDNDLYKKTISKSKEIIDILSSNDNLETKFGKIFTIFNQIDMNQNNDFLMFIQGLSKIAKYIDNLSAKEKLSLLLDRYVAYDLLKNKQILSKKILNFIGKRILKKIKRRQVKAETESSAEIAADFTGKSVILNEEEAETLKTDSGCNKIEYIFLDQDIETNKTKIKSAINDRENYSKNKVLFALYPFSNVYDNNSLSDRQLSSLYSQLSKSFEDIAETLFSRDLFYRIDSDELYALRVLILELIQKAFISGNASLSKPIYVSCVCDGNSTFTVYCNLDNDIISEKQMNLAKSAISSKREETEVTDDYQKILTVTPQEKRIRRIEDKGKYYTSTVVKKFRQYYERRYNRWDSFSMADDLFDDDGVEDLEAWEDLSFKLIEKGKEKVETKSFAVKLTDVFALMAILEKAVTLILPILQKFATRLTTGMDEETALVDGMQETLVIVKSEEIASALRKQGFNAYYVSDKTVDEYGGQKIVKDYKGTRKDVRVKVDKKRKEIKFCFKANVPVDMQELKQALADEISSGRKIRGLKDIKRVVYLNNAKVNSINEDVLNEIKNEITYSVSNTPRIIWDFGENNNDKEQKISRRICKGIKDTLGNIMFLISKSQAKKYAREIGAMKGEYEFVETSYSQEKTEENPYGINEFINRIKNDDSIQDTDFVLDLSDQSFENIDDLENILKIIMETKLASKNGVSKNIQIKFNDETTKQIIDNNLNIYEKYGLIPMVLAKYALEINGRKILYRLSDIDIEQIRNLKGNDIAGFVIDDAILEKARNKRDGIKGILETLFAKNTPEEKYKRGAHAAQSSKFDYTARSAKDLQSIIDSGILSSDLSNAEQDIADLNLAWFSSDAKSYLEYLLKEDRQEYEQALGFIRGVVLNTVAKQITALDIIDIDNEKFLQDKENNMVQAILIMTVQQLANGMSLERLFVQTDLVVSDTMSAEEFLRKLNEKLDKVLRENETKIDTSEKSIIENNFDGIPDLLMDRYRPGTTLDKGINVSVMSVRSILRAA